MLFILHVPLILEVLSYRTVLLTKYGRFQASNGLSVSASTLGGYIQ
jgi:hypothetical protein